MPKQYGSNGINSDGSLMNVGNNIWDPKQGGRPSIRVHSDKNAYAPTTPPWLIGGTYEDETKNVKNKNVENKNVENKNIENKNVENKNVENKN